MNILFITDNLFPDYTGGSGRVVAEACRHLALDGHAVRVITRRGTHTAGTSIQNGVTVHRYATNPTVLHALRNLNRAMVCATTACRIDIAVICQPLPGFVAVHSRALRGIPLVRDFYGPWDEEYLVKVAGHAPDPCVSPGMRLGVWLRRWIDRHVLQRVAGIRVLSQYSADQIAQLCPDCRDRTHIVPGGVDIQRFQPADRASVRHALDLPPDRPILFTCRNLTRRMGLPVLIEAVALLRLEFPDLLLLIAGDGPQRDDLQRMIAANGLSNAVRLLGRIADDRLPHYYQAADLFVLPTQALEGFGLVTLEALACGTLVLATPQGGTLEILKGHADPFLLSGCDAAAMVSGIRAMLRRPETEKGLLRQQARQLAESYAHPVMTARLATLFRHYAGATRRNT